MTKFYPFIFACAMLLTREGVAETHAREDKIYVNLQDLVFDSSGIWFNTPVNGTQTGATALHFDGDSYYITYSEQAWRCRNPKCQRMNSQGVSICTFCGWPDKR